jgi:orotidine-5'-phosphate decarboxylase
MTEGFDQARANVIGRGEGELTTPHGFVEMLEARQRDAESLLCVGLDPVIESIPESFRLKHQDNSAGAPAARRDAAVLTAFNRKIVDAVAPHVSALKPNTAFYERYGVYGIQALKTTIRYVKDAYPTIPVILDAKRADIGATNKGYADMVKSMGADAVTVNPYFGIEGKGALDPILDLGDIGVIILCRTSNPEASRMQDQIIRDAELGEVPYYMMVAHMAEKARQKNPNVSIVVGATAPEQLTEVRKIFKGPILVPGLGKQGGRPEDLVGAFDERGMGIIANNASAIIHASTGEDFIDAAARAALDWQRRINAARELPRPEEPSREEKLVAREQRVVEIINETGAIRDGHFLLKSGKHGEQYVNKNLPEAYPAKIAEICKMMAEDFRDQDIEVVVGPATGGIILATYVAEALTRITGREVLGVYAEEEKTADGGHLVLKRGYDKLVRGKRALVVDDIVTTGGSLSDTVGVTTDAGAEVVGASVIWNRGGVGVQETGAPVLSSLVNRKIPAYLPGPDTCPACAKGIPLDENVGHGGQQQLTHP